MNHLQKLAKIIELKKDMDSIENRCTWPKHEYEKIAEETAIDMAEMLIKIPKEIQDEIENAEEDIDQYPDSDYNIGYFDGLKRALAVVRCILNSGDFFTRSKFGSSDRN